MDMESEQVAGLMGEMVNPFKTILDRLDAQDTVLARIRLDHTELMERWHESASDRTAIRGRLLIMEADRLALVKEVTVYREAMEVRVAAVEARDTIAEIRQAISLQLKLHSWMTRYKVRVRVLAAVSIITLPVSDNLVRAVFHRLGLI